MGLLVQNSNLTKQAFLLPADAANLSEEMMRDHYTPYSFENVDDTTLGGNWVINPPPQYTRFADIKERRRAYMEGSDGMGRLYSESINSFKEVATFRFGKPRFTGASVFFTDFYDADIAVTVRTGRDPGILYWAARAYTTVLSYLTPLPYLYIAGRVLRYFLGKPTSQYYYMVPTMHLYWASFQTMANQAAVNMGLISGLTKKKGFVEEGGVVRHQFSTEGDVDSFMNYANNTLPGLYRKGGGVDIFQIATRRQRIQSAWVTRIQSMIENNPGDNYERLNQRLDNALNSGEFSADVQMSRTFEEYLEAYAQNPVYGAKRGDPSLTLDDLQLGAGPAGGATAASSAAQQAISPSADTAPPAPVGGDADTRSGGIGQTNSATEASLADLLDGELADGAQFISYKIDHVSTVSESFSSSVQESSIAQTMNSRAQANIEKRFTLSGGQTGWALLDSITQAATDTVNGAISGMGVDGIVGAFMGSGFAEIPKYWAGSSAQLPKVDMTIELRAWSGDRFTIFNHLLVPYFGLLAGALPQMTGKSSYGAPFMCECYIPGKMQIKMGMIDSISVTRGVGNVGWTREGLCLGLDINVSVVDMSSIMAMPLTTSAAALSKLDPRGFVSDLLSDETPFNNYMAVLSALTLTEQVYMIPDISRRWRTQMEQIDSFWSKGNFASWLSDTMPGRLASGLLWKRTERPY